MKLERKKVLITGASSGLGRGLAVELARAGNDLVITARREELLAEVTREAEGFGAKCIAVAADATDEAAAEAVVNAGIEAFGHLDLAILNAGGGTAGSMAEFSAAEVKRIMRTNYDTMVNFLCPMIQHMKAPGRGGVIAYTGSPAGTFGLPKSGPYSAAKAAGRTLFDTCRIELADSGIRFVALYPEFTDTPGLDPNDVPVKGLIISSERAVKEMMGAIAREEEHFMFPATIRTAIALGRALPEPLRRRILGLAAD